MAATALLFGRPHHIGIFSGLSPDAFPSVGNGLNVLNQASRAAIIAGGLTIAVIVGELDLSIGFAAEHGGRRSPPA